MNVIFALILPIMYVYTLLAFFFGINSKKLRLTSLCHLIPSSAGIIGAIAVSIIFYVRSLPLDSELKALAREAFMFFAIPFLICSSVSVLSTLLLYATKKRPAAAITFSYCAAEVILLCAIMLSASTRYTEINVSVFVDLLALSCAFICLLSPALFTRRLSSELNDEIFVKQRKASFKENKKSENERKRIREVKKRIKNGKKQ